METNMTIETETNFVLNNVKQAFAPMTEAFGKLQTLEVPEATRDFVKRSAATAKDKAAEFQANSEKVTSALETAVSNSVSEATRIGRNIQSAFYQDVESFFTGIDRMASAKSLSEAFQVQTELVRAHGEVLAARAKSSTEYLSNLASEGSKAAQDNFAKATAAVKTA
jgi:phasin